MMMMKNPKQQQQQQQQQQHQQKSQRDDECGVVKSYDEVELVLKRGGEMNSFGFTLSSISIEEAKTSMTEEGRRIASGAELFSCDGGVPIASVKMDSSAGIAGLREWDVIVQVSGKDVRRMSADQVKALIRPLSSIVLRLISPKYRLFANVLSVSIPPSLPAHCPIFLSLSHASQCYTTRPTPPLSKKTLFFGSTFTFILPPPPPSSDSSSSSSNNNNSSSLSTTITTMSKWRGSGSFSPIPAISATPFIDAELDFAIYSISLPPPSPSASISGGKGKRASLSSTVSSTSSSLASTAGAPPPPPPLKIAHGIIQFSQYKAALQWGAKRAGDRSSGGGLSKTMVTATATAATTIGFAPSSSMSMSVTPSSSSNSACWRQRGGRWEKSSPSPSEEPQQQQQPQQQRKMPIGPKKKIERRATIDGSGLMSSALQGKGSSKISNESMLQGGTEGGVAEMLEREKQVLIDGECGKVKISFFRRKNSKVFEDVDFGRKKNNDDTSNACEESEGSVQVIAWRDDLVDKGGNNNNNSRSMSSVFSKNSTVPRNLEDIKSGGEKGGGGGGLKDVVKQTAPPAAIDSSAASPLKISESEEEEAEEVQDLVPPVSQLRKSSLGKSLVVENSVMVATGDLCSHTPELIASLPAATATNNDNDNNWSPREFMTSLTQMSATVKSEDVYFSLDLNKNDNNNLENHNVEITHLSKDSDDRQHPQQHVILLPNGEMDCPRYSPALSSSLLLKNSLPLDVSLTRNADSIAKKSLLLLSPSKSEPALMSLLSTTTASTTSCCSQGSFSSSMSQFSSCSTFSSFPLPPASLPQLVRARSYPSFHISEPWEGESFAVEIENINNNATQNITQADFDTSDFSQVVGDVASPAPLAPPVDHNDACLPPPAPEPEVDAGEAARESIYFSIDGNLLGGGERMFNPSSVSIGSFEFSRDDVYKSNFYGGGFGSERAPLDDVAESVYSSNNSNMPGNVNSGSNLQVQYSSASSLSSSFPAPPPVFQPADSLSLPNIDSGNNKHGFASPSAPVENKRASKRIEKSEPIPALAPFIIPKSEITLHQMIGGGGFGKVYMCEWNLLECVIKIERNVSTNSVAGLSETTSEADSFEDEDEKRDGFWGAAKREGIENHPFYMEAAILSSLRHPNIVPCYGFVDFGKGSGGIVMQLMEGGGLDTVLSKYYKGLGGCRNGFSPSSEEIEAKYKTPLPFSQRVKWLVDICQGMLYLHKRNIIHRDLKSPNLLLDDIGRIHVSDFGLARRVRNVNCFQTLSIGGSPPYMAPEWFDTCRDSSTATSSLAPVSLASFVIPVGGAIESNMISSPFTFSSPPPLQPQQTDPYSTAKEADSSMSGVNRISHKVDVYSFGVIMWEIWTLRPPWGRSHVPHIVMMTATGKRPPLPTEESSEDISRDDYKRVECPPPPSQYEELLKKCWAQNPDDRPEFTQILPILLSMEKEAVATEAAAAALARQ